MFLILDTFSITSRISVILPAQAPAVGEVLVAQLQSIGARIRAQRKRQKLSAAVTAEAAGMSRVTLHRIERGEPSVTMGAYLSAIDALGLRLDMSSTLHSQPSLSVTSPPESVRLAEFPQLKRLAWQLRGVSELSAADALNLYERNWRHIDHSAMQPAERALVQSLVGHLGGGRLLV